MHGVCFAPDATVMNELWVTPTFVVLIYLLVSRMIREGCDRRAFDAASDSAVSKTTHAPLDSRTTQLADDQQPTASRLSSGDPTEMGNA